MPYSNTQHIYSHLVTHKYHTTHAPIHIHSYHTDDYAFQLIPLSHNHTHIIHSYHRNTFTHLKQIRLTLNDTHIMHLSDIDSILGVGPSMAIIHAHSMCPHLQASQGRCSWSQIHLHRRALTLTFWSTVLIGMMSLAFMPHWPPALLLALTSWTCS